MMNVSQINTTVMKMLYASIPLEDTTASASQAIPGMELHAKVKDFSANSIRDDAIHLSFPPPFFITVTYLLGISHSH